MIVYFLSCNYFPRSREHELLVALSIMGVWKKNNQKSLVDEYANHVTLIIQALSLEFAAFAIYCTFICQGFEAILLVKMQINTISAQILSAFFSPTYLFLIMMFGHKFAKKKVLLFLSNCRKNFQRISLFFSVQEWNIYLQLSVILSFHLSVIL